eukprot:13320502-Heterocapsa_arctica.AAC.1
MHLLATRFRFGHNGSQAPWQLPRKFSSSDLCHVQKCEDFSDLRSKQLLHLDLALVVANRADQLEAI